MLTAESVSAVFSSVRREGRWEPADEIQVRAIAGAIKLDFTHAELPRSGEIELDVRAIAGDVEIVVPAGATVDLEATPVLGSVEQKLPSHAHAERNSPRDGPPPPLPTYFRIIGVAVCGSIRVTAA